MEKPMKTKTLIIHPPIWDCSSTPQSHEFIGTYNHGEVEHDWEVQLKLAQKVIVIFLAMTTSSFGSNSSNASSKNFKAALKVLNQCNTHDQANEDVEMAIENEKLQDPDHKFDQQDHQKRYALSFQKLKSYGNMSNNWGFILSREKPL